MLTARNVKSERSAHAACHQRSACQSGGIGAGSCENLRANEFRRPRARHRGATFVLSGAGWSHRVEHDRAQLRDWRRQCLSARRVLPTTSRN